MAISVKNLKRTGKGTPPAPAASNHNQHLPGKKVPLQLNIDPEVRLRFRVLAATMGKDMSELFVEMFEREQYKPKQEKHG